MFAPYITDNIVKLCNASIAEGQFPDSWKIAIVIPLFKKGSDADVNNYRPISILPVVSKIIEKHMALFFYAFLNNIICYTKDSQAFVIITLVKPP